MDNDNFVTQGDVAQTDTSQTDASLVDTPKDYSAVQNAEESSGQNADESSVQSTDDSAIQNTVPNAGPQYGQNMGPNRGPQYGPNMGPNRGPQYGPNMGPNRGPQYGPNMGPNAGPQYGPNMGSNRGPQYGPNMGPNRGPQYGPNMGPNRGPQYGPNMGANRGPQYGPNMGPNRGPQYGPAMGPGNASVNRVNRNVSADRIKLIGIQIFIYALVCAFCLFDNWSSILSAVVALFSVGLITFCIAKYEIHTAEKNGDILLFGEALSKQTRIIPWYALSILFSIAICLTGDGYVIFVCNTCMYLCQMFAIVNYFNYTKDWDILKGAFSMLEFILAPICYFAKPFEDRRADNIRNGKVRNKKATPIVIGLIIVLPILVIVLNLLASADPVFGKVVKDVFGKIFLSWDLVRIVLFAFLIFLFAYGVAVKATRRDLDGIMGPSKRYDPTIGCTISIVLTVFYVIFVAVQIIYLFMNKGSLPDSMSYSEYARTGFFQLLFVAVVNVCIVMVCDMVFTKSVLLRTVLFVMSICTYVMIASATMRMFMYISEYNLTYMRFNTLWALATTTVLLTGVVVKMFKKSLPLFNYSVMSVMMMLVIFAFCRPSAVIASYNLNPEHGTHKIDMSYVIDTGSDGVPYLVDYLKSHDIDPDTLLDEESDDYVVRSYYHRDNDTFAEVLEDIKEENDEKGYVRSFNFSKWKATESIKSYIQ